DPDSAEAAAARAGSDALVVGDVDSVQLRVLDRGGTGGEPVSLRLSVVDPGTDDGGTDMTRTTAGTTTTMALTATSDPSTLPAGTTPPPAIHLRAEWGADESLRSGSPSYGEVHAAFVHHTVNANGYSREDVPSILRGIYAYHTQSRGWSDIGYNFLVDRFGRIWEGRAGGVDRPVVGAHTLGYNGHAFAMSAIGNFDTAAPSAAMLEAYGQLFAWKLSLHGIAPSSRQTVAGDTFPAISGHRDAGQTACPGQYLYSKLSVIRSRSSELQRSYDGRDVAHSLAGSRWPDLLLRDKASASVQVVPGDGGPRFRTGTIAVESFGHVDLMTGVGDVTGDQRPDLLARDARTMTSYVYPGDGVGGFGVPADGMRRFAGVDLLAGAGDLDADGHQDVLGRKLTTGELLLYPGRGDGTFRRARLVLADATAYDLVLGAGDLDHDGSRDLLARSSAGELVLLATTHGRVSGTRLIATGWGRKTLVTAGMDVTGDQRPDIVARDGTSGRTWIYVTDAAGVVVHRIGGWDTWAGLDRLAMIGDAVGGRNGDIAGRTATGRLVLFAGTGSRWLRDPLPTGQAMSDADALLVVGDWDGDGHTDAMSRTRTGVLRLHRGDGTGRLGRPAASWTGWGDRRALVAPGDISGDGRPDLMARDPGGAVYLYPNDGNGGFRPRWIMRSSMLTSDLVAAAGRWDADGSPDLFVREESTQALWLYPVNGPGGLMDPVRLRPDFGAYDALVGVGDFDGDRRSDLLARHARSGEVYLFRSTADGLGRRVYVGPSLAAYDLLT
ncbi:MAG: FG-GAP-like repeat-containing protein, partial [Actinomycetota bacterium]|nr:FG-GAP-like repeat-containing protein [Actinomycetota bacterium]